MVTNMKKFQPAATPKLSSTNLPANRTNGEDIGMYVTISDSELLMQRITEHLCVFGISTPSLGTAYLPQHSGPQSYHTRK